MADAGLPPGSVVGSGKDGRVLKGDVLGAMAAAAAPAPASSAVAPAPAVKAALPEVKALLDLSLLSTRPEQRVPMSRLRARVAERLVQSQSTAAILTTFARSTCSR
jgi:2-oxoglutarate dehydrogenase E2 component (dihydrolipoamide succinyltransferase)